MTRAERLMWHALMAILGVLIGLLTFPMLSP